MIFEKIADIQKTGTTCVLVTVVGTKGSAPRATGTKMIVTEKAFFGTIGGGNLEWIALEEARKILASDPSSRQPVKKMIPLSSSANQCCGGSVEIFFDVVTPQPQLLIFGAGHVTQSLLEVLAGTDYHCVVIDEREEWIAQASSKKQQLNHLSLEAICTDPLQWTEKFEGWSDKNTHVLVMTHDHALDEQLVEIIIEKPNKSIGLIGSRTKRQRFEQRFLQREIAPEKIQKLRCPVGLPIGGKAPKEVAISIGAELLQFLNEENKLHSSRSRSLHQDGAGQGAAIL